ncbi:YidC/Oxa1 family membrane protein insertase [Microbacterium pygmaeum]|uniref:Membrane protein insertase YidC n=1 Tax=Microbacterium pygmaeum TaxID=370764 RepID=A0A1G7WEA6_9MICO|nr:membrane protein insertase YidC [Microbacterium pygmaeum]SDG70337.1 YidC/Oxa1 family membrane protein insertase [Microbacterium pygmaeum]
MNVLDLPPLAAILDTAYGMLLELIALLEPLAGTAAATVAVVLVTLLVRVALIPVGISQAKSEQTRARLAPRLRDLQRRFGKDRERLQHETMKLYADEKASPFAGCLPLLIQAPIVGVIYALFLHPAVAGHANALLSETLLGVPLGTSLASAIASGALGISGAAVFGILLMALVVVAEITRRCFRPPAVAPDSSAGPSPLSSPQAMNMMGFAQFATAVVAIFVPLAAGLYLMVTVTWTLGQRLVLRRRYPLP